MANPSDSVLAIESAKGGLLSSLSHLTPFGFSCETSRRRSLLQGPSTVHLGVGTKHLGVGLSKPRDDSAMVRFR